ncbi:NEXN [Branchiostoma lanceolatum]|uniref:NEXN protein n=1 Tax=Branchiostoma lanceolatum TaxID=7740 RepID=A0A8J9Z8R5_BRALA|nr:NEXN [Branchiostoma lanceolatum]
MVQPSKTKTMAKTGEGDTDQQSATEPSSNSVNGDNKKDPIVPGLAKVQLPRSAAKVVLQPKKESETSASYVPKFANVNVKERFEQMRVRKEEKEAKKFEEVRKERESRDQREKHSALRKQFLKELMDSDEEEEVKKEKPKETPKSYVPRMRGSVRGKFEEMQKQKEEEERRRAEEERKRRIEMDRQIQQQEQESLISKQMEEEMFDKMETPSGPPSAAPPVTPSDLPSGERRSIKGKFEEIQKQKEEEARLRAEEERLRRIEMDKLQLEREAARKVEEQEVSESDGDASSNASFQPTVTDIPRVTRGGVKGKFEAMRKAKEEERLRQMEEERQQRIQAETESLRLSIEAAFSQNEEEDVEEEPEVNGLDMSPRLTKKIGSVKGRYEEMQKARDEEHRRQLETERLSRLQLEKQAIENQSETADVEQVNGINGHSPHQQEEKEEKTYTSNETIKLRNRPKGDVKGRFEDLRKRREDEARRKTQEIRISRIEFDKMMLQREKEQTSQVEDEEEDGDSASVTSSLTSSFISDADGESGAPQPGTCGSMKSRFEALRESKEKPRTTDPRPRRLKKLDTFIRDTGKQANEEETEDKPEVKEDIPPPKRGSLRGKFEVMQRQKEEEARKKAEEERLRRLEEEKKILAEEAAKREAEYEEMEQLAEQRAEEKEAEAPKESIEEVTSPKVSLGKLKNKFAELQKKKESGSSEDDGTPREKVKPGKLKNKFAELQKKSSEDQENDACAEKAPKPGKLTISFEELARQKEEEARREAEEERKRKLEEDKQLLEEERARLEAEEAAAAAAASEGGDQEGEEPAESAPEESGPRLSVKERFALMQKKKEEEEEQRKLKSADVKEAGKNKRASALFEKFQNIDKVAEEERFRKVEEERARRLEMDREMLARELERTEKMVGMEEEAQKEEKEEDEEPKAAETEEDKVARKQRTRALFSRFENLESYEEQERRRRIEEEKRKRLMLEQREIDEARRKEVGGADGALPEEAKREEEDREREYMERFARGEASDVEDSDEDETLSATSETLAPKFVKNFENMTIFDGDPVRFEAKVIGRPKPDVTWYLNGKRLPNNQDYRYKFEGDHGVVLELPETFPEDEGEYMCKAVNTSGMALCSALLIIEDVSHACISKLHHTMLKLYVGKGHRAESSYIKQIVEPTKPGQPKAAAKKTTVVKQPANVQVKQTTVQTKSVNVQPITQPKQQKPVHGQLKQAEIPPSKEAVIKQHVVSKSEKITSTTASGQFIKKSSSTTSEKVVTKTTTSEVTSSKTEKSAAASAWELKYGGKPLTAQQLAKQKLAQKMSGNGQPPSPTVKVPVQKLYVGGKPAPTQTVPPKAAQPQGEPQPGAARKQWPPPTKGGSDEDTTKTSELVTPKIKEDKSCNHNGDKTDDSQTVHSNEKENKPPVKTTENGK